MNTYIFDVYFKFRDTKQPCRDTYVLQADTEEDARLELENHVYNFDVSDIDKVWASCDEQEHIEFLNREYFD